MAEEKEQSRGKSAVSSLGQQALGMGARRLIGQALSKAGAAIGSAFGPIGTAAGVVVGWLASNKWVQGLIGGAVFFFLILIPVLVISLFGFGGFDSPPVSAEEEGILSVTKTANPTQIKKNAPPTEVTYTITVENRSTDTTIKNIKIVDSFLGLDKTIGDLNPGKSHTEKAKHTFTDTTKDDIVENTVSATGTTSSTPSTGEPGLEFKREDFYDFAPGTKEWTEADKKTIFEATKKSLKYSKFRDLVFGTKKVTVIREKVDSDCPDICSGYAVGPDSLKIFDLFFTKTQVGQHFIITHELTHIIQKRNTTVFDNYQKSAAYQEYKDKFVIRSYPLCHPKGGYEPGTCMTDPFVITPVNEDFAEMAGNYVADRDGYQVDFSKEYPEHNKFAKSYLFGEPSSPGGGATTGETVTDTDTALVIIGSPQQGPPVYAPLKDGVYCSGFDFRLESTPACPLIKSTHIAIDIATTGSDSHVYSPFAGFATVHWVDDDGDGPNNFGVHIDLTSGEYKVRMSHLERGSELVSIGDVVSTNEPLAVYDCTGTCDGNHIHYVVWKGDELVDPKDYGGLVDHP
jgi:hypothetical protein